MPYTPVCPAGAIVEISEDGTVWTDISDFVGRVDPGARERPLMTYKTFTGSKSCTGPADPTDIELEFGYSEADTDPYAILRDAHYNGTTIGLRWHVLEGVGAKEWTAAEATVPTWDEPEVNADADTPLTVLATLSADVIGWTAQVP
jgi:hypothetical protein